MLTNVISPGVDQLVAPVQYLNSFITLDRTKN